MPIYAYRCASCGHQKDVLQKMSDAPLSVCPACGAQAFGRQVSAPAFQLKGSGWYVTDFRDKNKGGEAGPAAKSGETGTEAGADKPAGADAPASKPAESAGASAAPAPSGSSAGSGSDGPASSGSGGAKAA
ncbi:MAG: FmdB family zinc ribbon protein [Burkholderiaceae bacterium]